MKKGPSSFNRGTGKGNDNRKGTAGGGSARGAGKSFDKPKRSFNKDDSDRKPFRRSEEEGRSSDRPKRSFDNKDGDRKPFRKFDGDGKSFDRPKRSFNKEDGDRKPFRKSEGDGKSFDRPKRSFDKKDGDRKPFRKFEGDGKSFDRPKRSFDKEDGERKPFRKFEGDGKSFDRPKRSFDKKDGDRKPFRKFEGDGKSSDRPKRSFDKEDGERKPFRKFEDDGKSFDKPKRSFDKKDGGKKSDKPKRFSERNVFKEDKPAREIPEYEKNFVTPKEFEKTLEDSPKYILKKKEEDKSFDKPYPLGSRKVSGPFRKKFKENADSADNEEAGADKEMTLNKYIAHSGVTSRREAGEMVKQGKVKVNGELILEPGYRVQPGDLVTIAGKKLTPTKNMVYVLLNKPKGYITTTEDPEGRDTVMDLISGVEADRVYPVGRLDRNTTGLLLLTNDGALAQKLSHPSYEVKKVYQVTLDKALTKAHFEQILSGLQLEDGAVKVDALSYLDEKNELGIEIHSGKNRIVRRIFESLGYEVEKLDRVMYAGLTKKNLPRGKWRLLSEKEIILLKHFKS